MKYLIRGMLVGITLMVCAYATNIGLDLTSRQNDAAVAGGIGLVALVILICYKALTLLLGPIIVPEKQEKEEKCAEQCCCSQSQQSSESSPPAAE